MGRLRNAERCGSTSSWRCLRHCAGNCALRRVVIALLALRCSKLRASPEQHMVTRLTVAITRQFVPTMLRLEMAITCLLASLNRMDSGATDRRRPHAFFQVAHDVFQVRALKVHAPAAVLQQLFQPRLQPPHVLAALRNLTGAPVR